MKAKKFKNWTDEEFRWKWNGVEHVFPAGMEIFLEEAVANHFAKHLTDRELNKLKIPTDTKNRVEELMARCFPSSEIISPEQALNLNEEVKAKKKGRVAKKEEEFPDLKTK